MALEDSITVSQDELEGIIRALKCTGSNRRTLLGRSILDKIAKQGWAQGYLVGDLVTGQDNRLILTCLGNTDGLASKLGLVKRFAFLKPRSCNDEPWGTEATSAAGVACMLIWLERLGFGMDASPLCDALHEKLADQEYVSDEELMALSYRDRRHRMPPVRVSVEPLRALIGEVEEFTTANGYQAEVRMDADQLPVVLEVHSPGYVEPPPQETVTCPECGVLYVRGLRSDEHLHNIVHNKVATTLRPVPSRALRAALASDPEKVWVSQTSPKWQRIAVERRARAFKREFNYDFIQWCADHDPEATAFLFHDDDHRIIGACCFRPASEDNPERMRLDWIWLCPDARRQGWLSRHWDRFLARFGEFDIEHPISEAMEAFLKKRGLKHLIRQS